MNKCLLSCLYLYWAYALHLLGAMLCTGHGSTPVPAQHLPGGPCDLWHRHVCGFWSTHHTMVLGSGVVAWGLIDLLSYPKCGPGTAASPGSSAEMPTLQPHSDFLNGSMQYNKTLRVHAHYLKTQEEVLSQYTLRLCHRLSNRTINVSWGLYIPAQGWGPTFRASSKLARTFYVYGRPTNVVGSSDINSRYMLVAQEINLVLLQMLIPCRLVPQPVLSALIQAGTVILHSSHP